MPGLDQTQRDAHHDREDTLLHLTRVLRAEDDHLHALEVDLDGGRAAHALGEAVGGELASVVDDEVGLAEVLELFLRRADEHVVLQRVTSAPNPTTRRGYGTYHEQGVIGPSTDDPDLDAVLRIPLRDDGSAALFRAWR